MARNKIYHSITVRKGRFLEMHCSAKKVEVENLVSLAKGIDLEMHTTFEVCERLANWRDEMSVYESEYVRVRGKVNP